MRTVLLACPALAPMGGKQRDCLAIADALKQAGAEVAIATWDVDFAKARGFEALSIQARGLSNHARLAAFADDLARQRRQGNVVIGFERMPGIDYYYAADPLRPRAGGLRALLPRDRTLSRLAEQALGGGKAYSFFLTEAQADAYAGAFAIPASRFEVLPPIIHPARAEQATKMVDIGSVRSTLGVAADAPLVVAVAVVARTKGADLTIAAMPSVPKARLVVIGARDPQEIASEAARAGVSDRVSALPYAEQVMDFLKAADVLVHPARIDNTGTVIVEALMAGTPAVVTSNCGYAPFVARGGAGVVLHEQPSPADIAKALNSVLDPADREGVRDRAAAAGLSLRADAGRWLQRIVERVLA